jgi:hypothetical protein
MLNNNYPLLVHAAPWSSQNREVVSPAEYIAQEWYNVLNYHGEREIS